MDVLGGMDVGADGTAESAERQRSLKRDSLFLSAQLRLDGDDEAHDVRVRNLSAGGLMAELDRIVATGVAVRLEMRGVGAMTGRVAWCTRGRVGIALDKPIDPNRARKPVGNGTMTPSYAKPLIVPGRR